ncbi:MAG TPA: J domain-containing protein [Acidimicrobiales bacterium]
MTHYERLGVSPAATTAEIKAAYHRLARRVHPDAGGGLASAEMAAANEAWRVLSDPGRRAMYDASLRPASGPRWEAGPEGATRVDAPDLDDYDDTTELTPAEMEAAHRLGITLAITAVAVSLILFALFVYAFTRSGSLAPDPTAP